MSTKTEGKKKTWELPKDFLESWLEALRSGKYEQGEGSLVQTQGFLNINKKLEYCCLGVAGTICNIDKDTMLNVSEFNELINDFKAEKEQDLKKDLEEKVPSILIKVSHASKEPLLSNILMYMNDGLSFELKNIKSVYPNIWMSDKMKNIGPGESINFSFEEIAEFLENNVEPI